MSTVELEELKRKIGEVSNQNKELDNKVETVGNDIRRILYYLNDDPLTGNIGLVQKVKHTETNIQVLTSSFMDYKQQKAIEKAVRKAQIATWATVAGFAGGGLLWLFKIFLTYFLAKVL